MIFSPIYELERRSLENPDRRFMVDGQSELTFGEVYRQVRAVGGYLHSIGIDRGDRVAVMMPRSHKQAVAQLGVMAAGAVLVPVSDLLKEDHVAHIVSDCDCRAIIADEEFEPLLPKEAEGLKVVLSRTGSSQHEDTLELILNTSWAGDPPELISQDNATIIYSSGSTGMPKGIVLSHRNLWDGSRIISHYLGIDESDRLAQVLSLNFDYGINQLTSAIYRNCELHFHTFHFPKDLFDFIRISEITTLALMPVFLNRIFDPMFFKPALADGITSLRRITTTGGRMNTDVTLRILDTFPDTDLYLMYGLTEAFRSTYLEPAQARNRPTSIGKAIPEAEILVLDEAGNPCPPDVPGELVHRGGIISKGYWNQPEKTAERFKTITDASGTTERVVYSGDIVKRDAEGYLYFVGRKDNMIKTSGHRVSPEEIERQAEAVDGVQYAVAFSVPHRVLGEEIILVLVAEDEGGELDLNGVTRHLREHVPAYMVPRRMVQATTFEVTPGNQGKVSRSHLIEEAKVALELE